MLFFTRHHFRLGDTTNRLHTYTNTLTGVYTYLFEKFSNKDGSPPNFLMKAALGMTAGATGAFVGTPAEVALIRMTSDGNLPADQRRNYKSVFDALGRIFKEEGLFALWRGAIPTMGRAMVVNAAQLASYSQAKQFLLIIGKQLPPPSQFKRGLPIVN